MSDGSLRVRAIRVLALVCAVSIAIETLPDAWAPWVPGKPQLHAVLCALGLHQGDWPLFAPNPKLRNGWVVAEVVDTAQQEGTWTSPDWSRATIWQKFYRFRHMNYYQRVSRSEHACNDLADYLQRAIPTREPAIPTIRWSESNEILPPAEWVPPMVSVQLVQYRQRMLLSDDNPMPKQSETTWSQQSSFLVKRQYPP